MPLFLVISTGAKRSGEISAGSVAGRLHQLEHPLPARLVQVLLQDLAEPLLSQELPLPAQPVEVDPYLGNADLEADREAPEAEGHALRRVTPLRGQDPELAERARHPRPIPQLLRDLQRLPVPTQRLLVRALILRHPPELVVRAGHLRPVPQLLQDLHRLPVPSQRLLVRSSKARDIPELVV